jgi:CheY-like chemotaxis protein
MVDPNQIEQVLLNILNNAEQAIQDTGHTGLIMVSSRQNNDRIFIEISDTGAGIPKESVSKIFDPFYTTKDVGQGTGLGLSVSYGIIQEHGGSIKVDTKQGKGSTFTIALPVIEKGAVMVEEISSEMDDRLLLGKRVLIIDDEAGVLDFLSRYLHSKKCEVKTASNGQQALNMLRSESFDLIVCDVKMPVMDGKALYTCIGAEMPEMTERIVFSTGDLIGRDTVHFLESTRAKCVHKPFDLIAIKKVLCEIILQTKREHAPLSK